MSKEDLKALLIPKLNAVHADSLAQIEHSKTHWASCSIDLPSLPSIERIKKICDSIPDTVLRVKGCTRVGEQKEYTYFERTPDGEVSIRAYRGKSVTGSKLLAVGVGSDPIFLKELVSSHNK